MSHSHDGPAEPGLDDLQEGLDFLIEADGALVFTADFLRRRGHCCALGCRHCPYGSPGSG